MRVLWNLSILKFPRTVVYLSYWYFPPLPTTLNVKYLSSRSTEVIKRIRGFFFYPI